MYVDMSVTWRSESAAVRNGASNWAMRAVSTGVIVVAKNLKRQSATRVSSHGELAEWSF
jgi:hypothetical protein